MFVVVVVVASGVGDIDAGANISCPTQDPARVPVSPTPASRAPSSARKASRAARASSSALDSDSTSKFNADSERIFAPNLDSDPECSPDSERIFAPNSDWDWWATGWSRSLVRAGSANSDDEAGCDDKDPPVRVDDVARIARRCASSSCCCCTSKAGFRHA